MSELGIAFTPMQRDIGSARSRFLAYADPLGLLSLIRRLMPTT